MSYTFKPEEQKIDYPERVAAIKKIYEDEGFDWKLDPEADIESVKETAYQKLAKERPDTAYYEVLKVMRLKDAINNKEYMIWKLRKYVASMDPIEIYYGVLPYPLHTAPLQDADGNVVNKVVRSRGMMYTQEWDVNKFNEIMKDARNPRTQEFYIAETSDVYEPYWYGKSIKISDIELFRKSSWEDLMEIERKESLKNRAIK